MGLTDITMLANFRFPVNVTFHKFICPNPDSTHCFVGKFTNWKMILPNIDTTFTQYRDFPEKKQGSRSPTVYARRAEDVREHRGPPPERSGFMDAPAEAGGSEEDGCYRRTAPSCASRAARMALTSSSASAATMLRSSARMVRLNATDLLSSATPLPR